MFQNLRVFDRPVVLRDMVYEFDTKNNAERRLRVFCSECFHIFFYLKRICYGVPTQNHISTNCDLIFACFLAACGTWFNVLLMPQAYHPLFVWWAVRL